MQKSKSDHFVFYRNSHAGIILLVVYVDDIIITGNDMVAISSLKSFLHVQFHTKDLGMLKYFLGVEVFFLINFLGVEVMKSKREIFLFQRKYVLDLLSEIGKLAAKPCQSPMTQSLHLNRKCKLFEDSERYRRLVGKLNYCGPALFHVRPHSMGKTLTIPSGVAILWTRSFSRASLLDGRDSHNPQQSRHF